METLLKPSIARNVSLGNKFKGFDFYNMYGDDFNFNDYKPPLYSFESVCLMIVGYLVAIRLTTWYMFNKKPISMRWPSAIHNLFLFVISVVMFFGVSLGVLEIYSKGGSEAIFV